MRKATWTPDPEQNAETLIFGPRPPYAFVDIGGHLDSEATPSGVGAPRQMGETFQGVTVGPRVITLTIGLVGESPSELVALRRQVAHAFTDEPALYAETPKLGTLRFEDDGADVLEIDAAPRGGLKLVSRDATREMEVYDVELYCPDPRWRSPGDLTYSFEEIASGGGLELPFELPFEMPSTNSALLILNPGSVSTPVIVRVYGEVTNPRVINGLTNEVLALQGTIESGQYVEIDTSFGHKGATLVEADGTRSNALPMLDLTVSVFWSLRPGLQAVLFESDSNVDGFVDLFYRPRYMAV